MTKEDKELLLKDICARLPYGVIINIHDTFPYSTLPCFNMRLDSFVSILSSIEPIFKTKDKLIKRILKEHTEYLEFKPYLRPMSSMTEEEKKIQKDYIYHFSGNSLPHYEGEFVFEDEAHEYIDWLNAHHFDYRGLIEKGLAIEAPKDMYNIK